MRLGVSVDFICFVLLACRCLFNCYELLCALVALCVAVIDCPVLCAHMRVCAYFVFMLLSCECVRVRSQAREAMVAMLFLISC